MSNVRIGPLTTECTYVILGFGGTYMAKKKAKEKEIQSWVVTVRRTCTSELICEGCTEDEAQSDPYAFCIDERDLETTNWDVTHVEPML
jgi:hypothetical protein